MRKVILCLLLCLSCSVGIRAQSTGAAIAGTVLDPDGKIVQKASVVMKNEGTGIVRLEVTDAEGRFTAQDLAPGTYALDVTAAGFAAAHRTGVRATTGVPENISISLSLEKLSEDSFRISSTLHNSCPVAEFAGGTFRTIRDQSGFHTKFHCAHCRLHSGGPDGAGYFQFCAEWSRPRRQQDVLSRIQGRPVHDDLRRHSLQRHERSDAPLVGVLPRAIHRYDII